MKAMICSWRHGAALAAAVLAAACLASGWRAQDAPEAYTKAWVVKTGDWNNGVVVAPWGDVVSMSARKLRVMAQDTGQVLEVAATSFAIENALAFTSDSTCVVVCAGGVEEITFPGGATRVPVHFPQRAEAAAASPAAVAAATEEGHCRVYAAKDWALSDEFDAGGKVEGLALSKAGDKLAIGLQDGRIFLRDERTKKMATLREADQTKVTPLAFSSDGTRLFTTSGIFKAALWDTAKGTEIAEYTTGSWLTSAVVLPPQLVAAAGADGLVFYTKPDDPARLLKFSGQSFETSATGLASTPDGKAFFVGNRDGDVACFASRPLKASAYKGAGKSEQGGAAQGGQAAPETPSNEIEVKGVILGRDGAKVTVKSDAAALPTVGSEGTLSKYFETKLASFTTSGWLEIASVRVTKVSAQKLELQILERKSVMTVNGQEVDHFKEGNQVKLVVRKAA